MALNLKWSMLIVLILCINSIFCRTKPSDLYITTKNGKKPIYSGGFYNDNKNLVFRQRCLYRSEPTFCKMWALLYLPMQELKIKKGKCDVTDTIYEINVYDSDGDHTREIANLKYKGQNKKSNKICISFNNGCRMEGRFNYNNMSTFGIYD